MSLALLSASRQECLTEPLSNEAYTWCGSWWTPTTRIASPPWQPGSRSCKRSVIRPSTNSRPARSTTPPSNSSRSMVERLRSRSTPLRAARRNASRDVLEMTHPKPLAAHGGGRVCLHLRLQISLAIMCRPHRRDQTSHLPPAHRGMHCRRGHQKHSEASRWRDLSQAPRSLPRTPLQKRRSTLPATERQGLIGTTVSWTCSSATTRPSPKTGSR